MHLGRSYTYIASRGQTTILCKVVIAFSIYTDNNYNYSFQNPMI